VTNEILQKNMDSKSRDISQGIVTVNDPITTVIKEDAVIDKVIGN
jgi:hypothetical protein